MKNKKTLAIIHLGVGNVGRKLFTQIQDQQLIIEKKFSVKLTYCGMFTAKGGVFKKEGFSPVSLSKALEQIKREEIKENSTVTDALNHISKPFVLIDTTASDKTIPLLELALKRGGYVVLSNKKPLAASQSTFERLQKIGGQRFFYETTVGAGLPVIQTIKTLLATGDEIISIQGCFSGTLGFLFSELEKGSTFSEAVLKAKKLGFTEPDPRDDLSGVDVARKALILARVIGRKIELSQVTLQGLYPKEMAKGTIDEFLKNLPKLDAVYQAKKEKVKKKNNVLRFVATVTKTDCHVGLEEVAQTSDIGGLSGPDNIIVIKTKRYFANPLVIKGPGAGIEVTAAGVFGDMIEIVKKL